jgi:chorismate mutase
MNASRTITFQFLLHDEPGALSAILMVFAEQKANLLTVNSITPSNGCAIVTVSVETSETLVSVDEMMRIFLTTPGVIKAEVLAAG